MEKTCLYLQMQNYFQNRLNEMSYMKDVCTYIYVRFMKRKLQLNIFRNNLQLPLKMYIILIILSVSVKMIEYFIALTPATHLEGKTAAIQLQNRCLLFSFVTGKNSTFGKQFYLDTKIRVYLNLVKKTRNTHFMFVTIELGEEDVRMFDQDSAPPGCINAPYTPHIQDYALPGTFWPIEDAPLG